MSAIRRLILEGLGQRLTGGRASRPAAIAASLAAAAPVGLVVYRVLRGAEPEDSDEAEE